MAELLAYNLTTSPLPLAAGAITLPASSVAGVRGPEINVTGKFTGLTEPDYAALEAQRVAGLVAFEWDDFPAYDTPGLNFDTEISRLEPVSFAAINIPVFANAERPVPTVGALLSNSTSKALNHSWDGLFWYDAMGNLA